MTDQAERWRKVAQAALWRAEGKEVEFRMGPEDPWRPATGIGLVAVDEYRLKPEPPKPIEFWSWVRSDGYRHPFGHATKEECLRHNMSTDGTFNFPGRPALFREVIEQA